MPSNDRRRDPPSPPPPPLQQSPPPLLFPDISDDGEGEAEEVGIGAAAGSRSSFSYHRLPEPLLRLSVLKLDGSSFDVRVAGTAAVWELKVAIEDIFSRASDDGEWNISWCHVWGHFCLCYKDRKLTDEKAFLRSFGIKDGDQLHFVRHLTINYNPRKRRSKSLETVFELHRRSLAGPEVFIRKEDYAETNEDYRRSTSCTDQQASVHNGNNDIDEQIKFKSGNFFRGWFSYSKLASSKKMHSKSKTNSSKSSKKSVRSKLGHWLSKKCSKVSKKSSKVEAT
ncbi:U11/U12 small nuclear ribonucleoprotein 25 kDa protein [Ananas comosus]|uniref:U11/U12 small nuclear ribonucleoprotein 25 kDa protein n=1 Tax=Ananas comosus TaxID=4615 RepID=A0A199UKG1_ANACO|nr:U11/U12 small nuclear ribonucleoprotein 25 kDa protein [Ananas comosus]